SCARSTRKVDGARKARRFEAESSRNCVKSSNGRRRMALFARDSLRTGELAQSRAQELLRDYSLEITAKDVAGFTEAAPQLVPGTAVSITFLPGDEPD